MKPVVPSVPTRIVKHHAVAADVATATFPAAREVTASASAREPAAPIPRHARTARLVTGPSGAEAIEVRCACGELTRVELSFGTSEKNGEKR